MIRYLLDEFDQMSGMFDALVVLHDDKDFATAARCLPDMRERTIYDTPPAD